VVVAGDGQVSIGRYGHQGNCQKSAAGWRMQDYRPGFAGATADAFTLFERLKPKLENTRQLTRAPAVECCQGLAQRIVYLRRLRSNDAGRRMLLPSLIITGTGDVLEPEDGNYGHRRSGGNYALAAARALSDSKLDAENILPQAMKIAADICVYTKKT